MEKYYRAIKDNFLWQEGAILKRGPFNNGASFGYLPIEEGVWDTTPYSDNDWVTAANIENNPEWFERVYPSNMNKALFVTADELKKLYSKFKK